MSEKIDLNALFNAPAEITARDIDPDLLDEFITGLTIYHLPESFVPDVFIGDFSLQAQDLSPGFPPMVCRTGKCTLLTIDGKAEETTCMELLFKHPVETEFVTDLLQEIIDDALSEIGVPQEQQRYYIYRADCIDYEEAKSQIEKANRPPHSGCNGPNPNGH